MKDSLDRGNRSKASEVQKLCAQGHGDAVYWKGGKGSMTGSAGA